jgi:hypothetical protein
LAGESIFIFSVVEETSEETLYYKYQVGTNKVLMKVIPKEDKKPEVPMATDDDVIVLTTMEDGSKELSFKFNEYLFPPDIYSIKFPLKFLQPQILVLPPPA